MVSIPVVFGVSCMGGDMIKILASPKYLDAAVIIPWTISPLLLFGALPALSAGLIIEKKTKLLLGYSLFSGAVNIVLNIILIPLFGIVGAAAATLCSYLLLTLITAFSSQRFLMLSINFSLISKFIAGSVLMTLVILNIDGVTLIDIIAKILVGALIYLSTVLLMDRPMRVKALSLINL